jgi:hypothetical protein
LEGEITCNNEHATPNVQGDQSETANLVEDEDENEEDVEGVAPGQSSSAYAEATARQSNPLEGAEREKEGVVNPEDAKPDRERRKLYFRDRDLSDAEWRRTHGF